MVTTWRCTWKLTLDKGLTNTDIEEIVTNISPKPQSWRYISFSTEERSPKCNSTQEKSPCEQCVKIVYTRNNIKHTWTMFFIGPRVGPVCTISCLSNWNWSHNWHKLGPINGFSPRWWRYSCWEVWSWSEYISTYFTYEISFVNHLYLLIGELHFYDNFTIFLLRVFKCVLKTLWL